MTDQMIVLTTAGKDANRLSTKVITRREDGSWDKAGKFAKYFSAAPRPVSSFDDMAAVLEDIAGQQKSLVIAGNWPPSADGNVDDFGQQLQDGVYRKKKSVFGSPARRWVMFDIDELEVPDGPYDLRYEAEEMADALIYEYLPPEFHDVSYVVRQSSSSGQHGLITDIARLHIWFWLDQAVEVETLKEWAGTVIGDEIVDLSLFDAVHSHFTADPVFRNFENPIKNRLTVVHRESDTAMWQGFVPTGRTFTALTRNQVEPLKLSSLDDYMAAVGEGDGKARFHQPLLHGSFHAVMQHPTVPDIAWINSLVERMYQTVLDAPVGPKTNERERKAQYLNRNKLLDYVQGAIRRREERIGNDIEQRDARPTVSLAEGEERIRQGIADFFDGAREVRQHNIFSGDDAPTLPVHAMIVTAGGGKTTEMIRQVDQYLCEFRDARIAVFVPEHRLGDQSSRNYAAMAKSGVPAVTLYGRRWTDPETGERPMCHPDMHDLADAVEDAGLSVRENVCATCPHAADCQWMLDMSMASDDSIPALFIAPSEYAINGTIKGLELAVYDEDVTDKGFLGGADFYVTTDQLMSDADLGSAASDADLHVFRRKLMEAVKNSPDGMLSVVAMQDASLTAADAGAARAIEWERYSRRTEGISPDRMSPDEIRRISGQSPYRFADRHARLWTMVETALLQSATPRDSDDLDAKSDRTHVYGIHRYTKTLDDGTESSRIAMQWTRSADKFPAVPTLLLDATANERLLRHFFPALNDVVRVAIEAPYLDVHFVSDFTGSKTSIFRGHGRDELSDKAMSVVRTAEFWANVGEKVGLITNKAAEDLVSADILTGHFNKLRGANDWEDCDKLFLMGRPMPRTSDIEWMMEALYWDRPDVTITRAEGRSYSSVAVPGKTPGQTFFFQPVSHPDEQVADQMRYVAESEVEQAIHRVRGVRRTADNPATVYLMAADVVPPVPVSSAVTINSFERSKSDLALSRGFYADNAADMAKAHPELWKDRKSFLNWRSRGGTHPLMDIYPKGMSTSSIRYQKCGAGQKAVDGWYFGDAATARPSVEAALGTALTVMSISQTTHHTPSHPIGSTNVTAHESGSIPARASNDVMVSVALADPFVSAIAHHDPDILAGGVLPEGVRDRVRETMHMAGHTQADLADIIGVSRPQLTNALAGRYGLSPGPAQRLESYLKAPPEPEQPRML